MRRRRSRRAGHGAGCRALSLLLAGLFATGFLPAAGLACDCTAEHNCGCTCWLGRGAPVLAGEAPGEPTPSCCARETGDGAGAAPSCTARTLSADGAPAPDGSNGPPHERRLLDWELTDRPAPNASQAARALMSAATIVPDSVPLEPPTPPPRHVPVA